MTKTLSHGKPLNFGTSNAQILVNRSIISTKYLNLISKSHRILKSLLFSSFYLVRIQFDVFLFLSSRRRSLETCSWSPPKEKLVQQRWRWPTLAVERQAKMSIANVEKVFCFIWTTWVTWSRNIPKIYITIKLNPQCFRVIE